MYLVRGIGTGGILSPLMADSFTGIGKEQIASATVGFRLIQNIGSVFGSAIITAFSTDHVRIFKHELKTGKYQINPDQMKYFSHQQLSNIRLEAFQNGFLVVAIASLQVTVFSLSR